MTSLPYNGEEPIFKELSASSSPPPIEDLIDALPSAGVPTVPAAQVPRGNAGAGIRNDPATTNYGNPFDRLRKEGLINPATTDALLDSPRVRDMISGKLTREDLQNIYSEGGNRLQFLQENPDLVLGPIRAREREQAREAARPDPARVKAAQDQLKEATYGKQALMRRVGETDSEWKARLGRSFGTGNLAEGLMIGSLADANEFQFSAADSGRIDDLEDLYTQDPANFEENMRNKALESVAARDPDFAVSLENKQIDGGLKERAEYVKRRVQNRLAANKRFNARNKRQISQGKLTRRPVSHAEVVDATRGPSVKISGGNRSFRVPPGTKSGQIIQDEQGNSLRYIEHDGISALTPVMIDPTSGAVVPDLRQVNLESFREAVDLDPSITTDLINAAVATNSAFAQTAEEYNRTRTAIMSDAKIGDGEKNAALEKLESEFQEAAFNHLGQMKQGHVSNVLGSLQEEEKNTARADAVLNYITDVRNWPTDVMPTTEDIDRFIKLYDHATQVIDQSNERRRLGQTSPPQTEEEQRITDAAIRGIRADPNQARGVLGQGDAAVLMGNPRVANAVLESFSLGQAMPGQRSEFYSNANDPIIQNARNDRNYDLRYPPVLAHVDRRPNSRDNLKHAKFVAAMQDVSAKGQFSEAVTHDLVTLSHDDPKLGQITQMVLHHMLLQNGGHINPNDPTWFTGQGRDDLRETDALREELGQIVWGLLPYLGYRRKFTDQEAITPSTIAGASQNARRAEARKALGRSGAAANSPTADQPVSFQTGSTSAQGQATRNE
jgi:hypothetical protein